MRGLSLLRHSTTPRRIYSSRRTIYSVSASPSQADNGRSVFIIATSSSSQPIQAHVPAVWLKDACQCSLCVHSSTRQKLFATGDIVSAVSRNDVSTSPSQTTVSIPLQTSIIVDQNVSTTIHNAQFDKSWLVSRLPQFVPEPRDAYIPPQTHSTLKTTLWNAQDFTHLRSSVGDIDYRDLQNPSTATKALLRLLQQLQSHGLIFVKNVPTDEVKAGYDEAKPRELETLVDHMGCIIRETFYGRTWDVKSVKNAKNIAYTNLDLRLHMDLCYHESPPGVQFLHSLKNSVTGGQSVFLDIYKAALTLKQEFPDHYKTLQKIPVTFHYENDGHIMKQHRYTISEGNLNSEAPFGLSVFYSPPFQGPLECVGNEEDMQSLADALRAFDGIMNRPEMRYVTMLKEGTTVIFRNLRVLHGRTQFDADSGERHFKGTYVDYDVVRDRLMVLSRPTP